MTERELSITRILAYPREKVFEAWTDARQLVKWFAPRGCQILVSKLDIREGGEFHWCIKNPKYADCWCTGMFIRIEYPSLIKYKIRLADENGNPMSAEKVFKEKDWPEETVVTVKFNEHAGHTELIIGQTATETLAKKTGAYQGWIEMLEILDEQMALLPPKY